MNDFHPYTIIQKKKNKETLTDKEVKTFINKFTSGEIHDYQMSALLMAISINGMNVAETAALTDAMLYSGETVKFKGNNYADKHSTGGVGDKASFILAPIASACGVKVPMIAGRGLGHTGGTIDKVEAIKGFKTDIDLKKFKKQCEKEGIVLIGQTPQIAPADRKIYAIRDVTATIDSVPLITASIMSKKLAEGAKSIIMDIKVGSGAFMRNVEDATTLAKSIIGTAHRFKRKSVALLTNMDQPLGSAVGHSLEIIESIETLKGNGPKDLTSLSIDLAAYMILLSKKAKTLAEAKKKARATIKDGSALKEFEKLIKLQGGDTSVINSYKKLKVAKETTDVKATQTGYIKHFENDQIGFMCTEIGGGRKKKTDKIDHSVGFIFHKKIGEKVEKNEKILTIYHHKKQQSQVNKIVKTFQKEIIHMSKRKVDVPKTVYKIIGDKK